jgi:hypothetical protein
MTTDKEITLFAPGYTSLADVLARAFEQASGGKGKERHATDLPFNQQPMQTLAGLYGPGFLLGQAAKKSQESQRLPAGRDVAELLGAINYLAGTVIYLERQRAAVKPVPQQYCDCTTDTGCQHKVGRGCRNVPKAANSNGLPCKNCTYIGCLKAGRCATVAEAAPFHG